MMDHLSASSLTLFETCGEAWRRRYIERHVIPPSAAMVTGTAVHQARRANLTAKAVLGTLLDEEASADLAHDNVAAAFEGEVSFSGDDTASKARGGAIDDAVRLAVADCQLFLPGITPRADGIEQKVLLRVPGIPDVIGYVDCLDTDLVTHELKTKSRSPTKGEADLSEQITVYSATTMQKHGLRTAKARYECLVKTKAIKGVTQETIRDVHDVQVLLNRLAVMWRAIQRGVFIPASPARCWMCSPAWCGYWHTCPYARVRVQA